MILGLVGVGGRGVVPGRALFSADATGFALHGESLFLVWPRKSNPKEGHPRRQAPAAPGFPPSVVISGGRHEGPSMALAALGFGILRRSTSCIHAVVAASMPLDPFHADSARPDEGGMGAVPTSGKGQMKSQEPGAFFGIDPESPGNTPIPCRSEFIRDRCRYEVSGAARVANEFAPTLSLAPCRNEFACDWGRHGASGVSPVPCPRRSRGRMTGRAFSLRGQRESDSPCKAKPVASAEESTWPGTKLPRQHPKTPSLSGKESAPAWHQGQKLTRSMNES
ncbi:hypothetical protein EV691_11661 [Azotobacter chroococcum]|uniref:Uncharacterized protein n=1 Tax=Azotobacter chroococcum TaxID=353 RepID=A0A4R1PNI5_9GAMM|nr:hypothetical protein EV691_11661 [Azotobacter chroococcum]